MSIRDHLQRLSREHYQGQAIVHWTLTIRDRQTGWLDDIFYYRFRELLTHTAFRYALACPVFCLMPDHLHLLWMVLRSGSNQLLAMKHLRKSLNATIHQIKIELQDQAYDHVLQGEEKRWDEVVSLCNYIARNPERAGLVAIDAYAEYPFTGCLVPGYPSLRPFDESFWDEFDRMVSFLKREGLFRSCSGSR